MCRSLTRDDWLVSCMHCFPCTYCFGLADVCVNHHGHRSQNWDRENVAVVVGRPFSGLFNELWLWLRRTRCIPTIKGYSPLVFIELSAIYKEFFHASGSSVDQQVPTCQSWSDVNEGRWVCNIYRYCFDLTLCKIGIHVWANSANFSGRIFTVNEWIVFDITIRKWWADIYCSLIFTDFLVSYLKTAAVAAASFLGLLLR